MRYLQVTGLDKPVSQLVMGSEGWTPARQADFDALLDAWVEAGGNIIDTARLYGGYRSEQAIGNWLTRRGARDRLLILDKGCHPVDDRSRVTERDLRADLLASLEALQTDYVDLYLLHRDDPTVPAGEVVEWLHEHHAAGRIRAYGGSNWTIERLAAANRYAAEHDLPAFAAVSNYAGLARQSEPPWSGTVTIDDHAVRWLAERGIPNFCWSAVASGFFTGLFERGQTDNELIARVYDSALNWERLRRASVLGESKGHSAIEIALAYVLNRPFRSFALVGFRTRNELESSLKAAALELSAAELAWLEGAGKADTPPPA